MADNGSDGTKSVSPARRVAFLAVALAIPLLFFVLLEGVLRIAGQRDLQPLFVASPGQPDYLQANPEVIKRFFAKPDSAPVVTIETAYFLADKPDDGLRIFVQGGSSAAGFPYGYGASLAGMLEQRLRRLMTDRPVEVISTAMSAVNSYTLLDFADEIIAQQPDAVLIYAGHNEYLGVLGVGSALSSDLSPGLTRATMRLRRFAVYRLIEKLVGGIGQAGETPDSGAGHTLMARIARDKAIAFGSPKFTQGIEQFQGNLDRLLAKYADTGIPVIVGLLASNERDRAPFASHPAPGTDAARLEELLGASALALESNALDEAGDKLAAAIELDGSSATAWFLYARLAARRGEWGAARERFRAARDRDQLRFRAPEVFNAIIRDTARRHGAGVADVQGAFAAASDNGIVGKELMLEHVHPNLDGYFLLADAYFEALFDAGVLVSDGELPDRAQARREIPVSEVDRLFGEYKLQRVINDWPFVATKREPVIPEPTNDIENLAYQMYHRRVSWPQATSLAIKHYREQRDEEEETRVALILADALPFAPGPQYGAGTSLIRANRPAEAVRYLARAAKATPDDINARLALSHALVLSGRSQDAREHLERALELDPDNTTARDALAQIGDR